MDDSISRQAVLDIVLLDPGITSWQLEMINKLPSAQQWIPCSERLPEENGENCSDLCLVTLINMDDRSRTKIDIARTKNGRWNMLHSHFQGDYPTNDVPYWLKIVAWMPLPEPYKGGINDKR